MRLSGKTVGVFVAPEFEDLEFWVPVMRLREEGARVVIIGLSHETVTGKHCLTAAPDIVAGEVRPDALDAVVVPGGWAPDKLRRDADVLRLVRDLHGAGKTVAFICHAGWVAGGGAGRTGRLTGWSWKTTSTSATIPALCASRARRSGWSSSSCATAAASRRGGYDKTSLS